MRSEELQPLQVEVTRTDGAVVLAPIGEVDIASVGVFSEALNAQLDAGSAQLVVDFGRCTYLDSTGLGCITAGRRRARDLGGDLVLVCTQERLLRLFAITGLDDVFTLCRTLPEALGKLQEGTSP